MTRLLKNGTTNRYKENTRNGDRCVRIRTTVSNVHILGWPLQKPNSWTHNFVEISGHKIESSQTWGFHIQCFHCKPVSTHIFTKGGWGGGVKSISRGDWIARRKTRKTQLRPRIRPLHVWTDILRLVPGPVHFLSSVSLLYLQRHPIFYSRYPTSPCMLLSCFYTFICCVRRVSSNH